MKWIAALREERTLAVVVLAGGIFVGLAYPPVADTLRPWALPALFLVIVFSLVPFAGLASQELISVDQSVLRIVLWQQMILPSIAIAAGVAARFPDQVVMLLIVTACSGALFSSPAIAELLGLNRRRALQAMILSTVFTPVSLFLFLSAFQGIQAELDIRSYALRTLVYLVAPLALLAIYRPLARRIDRELTATIDKSARWATIVALLVFGTGLMSAVSDKLDVDPARVLFLLVLATLLCLLMMGLTVIVMHRFGRREAFTAAVVSGFRNIGLGFALVGEAVNPELAVYAGISLIPVFIAPLLLMFLLKRDVLELDRAAQTDQSEPDRSPIRQLTAG